MTNLRFDGKAVLITGGGSGIGRATAQRLASEGATVRIGDVDEAGLAATADGFPSISTARCDVTDEGSVKDLVATCASELGAIDVLVNMAGILIFENSHELSLRYWQRIIDVNLTGTFLVCREALPHLVTSKGVIVNAASTAAHIGQPWSAAYCASKGAILSMTRALAVEYGRKGVRVNSVHPGFIETPMVMNALRESENENERRDMIVSRHAMLRLGVPREIADAIVFLASDESSFMTGSEMVVDGGYTAA